MEPKEAYELIETKLAQVYIILKECEELAENHDVSFNFVPAYGMGGTYIPEPKANSGWDSSMSCYQESNYGWQSSSSGR